MILNYYLHTSMIMSSHLIHSSSIMDYLYQIINLVKGWSKKHNFEDRFYQLLHEGNYDDALKLAQQHTHLDMDLVYKCKWRNSGVTVLTINTVLSNIQDKLWAINECVNTVPISYEACRRLLEFGLSLSSLSLGEEQQKELYRCRQDLLRYQHSLLAYENILGDNRNFDHVFYDEFRQKSPLEACIDYAHEGDAHAVEIMLNFYTDDLTPHSLAILSNFPETLSPYQYRNLLSRLNEDVDVLSQWFKERAIEMESKTLLLTNAIQLLHLGSELNIKDLKETHDDLVEFDQVVHECCTENNIYLSFADFNKMPQIERLILMTGDSPKNCKDRFRFLVIPYIHRRESKLDKANLLRDYFRRLAHSRERICRLTYNDLLDKIECDEFVAEWTKGLDEIIDEIGEEIERLEHDRQAKQLSAMASQTMALGAYDECYEACQMIMKKGHKKCWALCCQLGMHKQFYNNEAKYKLLAFALAYCDAKMSVKILDYIIELRKRDEKIQLAYLELHSE